MAAIARTAGYDLQAEDSSSLSTASDAIESVELSDDDLNMVVGGTGGGVASLITFMQRLFAPSTSGANAGGPTQG